MANNSFGWMAYPDNELVAPHMEYMRKNRWVLDFPTLAGMGLVKDAGKSLRLNCSKAARPKISFEEVEVKRLNGSVYLAGKPKYEPLSVTFYDSVNIAFDGNLEDLPSASNVLEQWRSLIYQPNAGDAFGSVGKYKGFVYLHMLRPSPLVADPVGAPVFTEGDANNNIAQTWLFQGLFPQNIEYGEVDYGSNEVQEVTVTFRYDRAMSVKPGTITTG